MTSLMSRDKDKYKGKLFCLHNWRYLFGGEEIDDDREVWGCTKCGGRKNIPSKINQ